MSKAAPARFMEQADYERGFAAHFDAHIAPLLHEIEAHRTERLETFIFACLVCFILAMAGTAFIWLYVDTEAENRFQLTLVCFGFAGIWPMLIYQRYAEHIKGRLLPTILGFFGSLRFHPDTGMNKDRLLPFGILPQHNIYECDDYLSGTLEEVAIELGEIILKNETRSRRGRHRVTIFRGVGVILRSNKSFKGYTIIKQDAGMLGNWLRERFNELERVALEDPRFEQKFEVYSTDQVEARYLLTTAFMDRLLDLAELMRRWGDDPAVIGTSTGSAINWLFSAGKLQASFYNNELLLLIPCGRDLFEPGTLFRSAYHLNEIRCVLYQVYLIRRIIEVLKMNQRIGM